MVVVEEICLVQWGMSLFGVWSLGVLKFGSMEGRNGAVVIVDLNHSEN